MAQGLPKARRVGGHTRRLTWILSGLIVVLLGVVGYLLLGTSLFDDAPQTSAERDYLVLLEAARKDPKNTEILMTLAEAEYALGKKRDALEHAEAAVKLGGEETDYRFRFAMLLVREDRLDEAEGLLEKEIELVGKDSAEPYFLLAQVRFEQQETEEALEMMRRALEINPMAADMRATYAGMLERSGDEEGAIEQYQTALKFLPGNADIIDALGRLGVQVDETGSVDPHGGSMPVEGSDQ